MQGQEESIHSGVYVSFKSTVFISWPMAKLFCPPALYMRRRGGGEGGGELGVASPSGPHGAVWLSAVFNYLRKPSPGRSLLSVKWAV